MSTTLLDHWADLLLEALDTGKPGATVVRLSDDRSGEHELAVRPIDVHPLEALSGFEAPASCFALGVATGGWAAPMDGIRPSEHPEGQRIFQVVLVDRSGRVASRIRFPDGSIMTDAPGSGAVLDALRQALGVGAAA